MPVVSRRPVNLHENRIICTGHTLIVRIVRVVLVRYLKSQKLHITSLRDELLVTNVVKTSALVNFHSIFDPNSFFSFFSQNTLHDCLLLPKTIIQKF